MWELCRLTAARPDLAGLIRRPDGRVRVVRGEDVAAFEQAVAEGRQ